MRQLARRLVPFPLRVELVRLRGAPLRLLERRVVARERVAGAALAEHGFVLAERSSPLRREPVRDERLQRGKERNVGLAVRSLDGVLVRPGQLCSYQHIVGRPSRLRGFVPGLELHGEQPGAGIGGGCCQVSNLLYLLCLQGGMRVVERHRHGLDLFPDSARTVPFGCGATVFYGTADLRFDNPLDQPVLLRMAVEDGALVGSLCCVRDPGFRVEIEERDHRFFREGGHWQRENRIVRRILDVRGGLILEQQVAHNRARTCYEPPGGERC
jgi:vancomycin resistance protein VanW